MSYRNKSAGSILAALLTMVAPKVLAQQTAVTTPPPTDKDESVVLSPFVVSASEDAGSYSATSTLAGTRVRTDLRDTASAISVVTQQFLQDTGATNAADLLVYTPSTEVGGIGGNFSG
ncbi:MAG TPA: TonB-dependent receptor plug domain-containing protein, partial [Opitutaceae bacterium]